MIENILQFVEEDDSERQIYCEDFQGQKNIDNELDEISNDREN